MLWSEIGSRSGEPGSTPPPRIPRSAPLLGSEYSHGSLVDLTKLVVFYEQGCQRAQLAVIFSRSTKSSSNLGKIILTPFIPLCIKSVIFSALFPQPIATYSKRFSREFDEKIG